MKQSQLEIMFNCAQIASQVPHSRLYQKSNSI